MLNLDERGIPGTVAREVPSTSDIQGVVTGRSRHARWWILALAAGLAWLVRLLTRNLW